MSFSILDQHEIIGWDFDGTLLDHPKSVLMHQYIAQTPAKTHYIITHRSHNMEKTMWDEMEFHYPGSLSRELFNGVVNISDELYNGFYRSTRSLGGLIIPDYDAYVNWKGEICQSLGVTIMIDDNSDHVRPGCVKHGIAYIHPDNL